MYITYKLITYQTVRVLGTHSTPPSMTSNQFQDLWSFTNTTECVTNTKADNTFSLCVFYCWYFSFQFRPWNPNLTLFAGSGPETNEFKPLLCNTVFEYFSLQVIAILHLFLCKNRIVQIFEMHTLPAQLNVYLPLCFSQNAILCRLRRLDILKNANIIQKGSNKRHDTHLL